MLIVAKKVTVNFDNVLFMSVEGNYLVLDEGDYNWNIEFDSSEKAHQARHSIESAYVNGEKICKI